MITELPIGGQVSCAAGEGFTLRLRREAEMVTKRWANYCDVSSNKACWRFAIESASKT